MRNLKYNLIALFAGASLTLAFAPFNIFVVAFLAPAILLGISLNTSKYIATWRGWLFGIGFFGTSASWVYISIHTYGGTNIFLAILLTALFIAVLGLFIAVSIYLFRLLTPGTPNLWRIFVFFPLCWVFGDWLRSWVGSGFPWVYLGYSQLTTPLHGFAPVLGIYGVSFITAFCVVLVYLICIDKSTWRTRIIGLVSLGIVFGLGASLSRIKWTYPTNQTLTISLIQGNIEQEMKWDPKHFNQILATYKKLTKPQLGRNVIIWPEGAIPAPTYYISDYLAELDGAALANHSTILVGTILSDSDNNLYNGMIALGMSQGTYQKRHLVPFGEYVPFQHWLRGLINFFDIPMSDLLPGPRKQALINVNGLFFSPSICYEIAYPTLIWRHADKANVLINISDDSWFGHSIAAAQQLQIAQMRALETGRPMIVVNNDGITGMISIEGQVIEQLPQNKTDVLQSTVTGYTGMTPIVRFMRWVE
jgi:apolipoprotein N-acyltransferase